MSVTKKEEFRKIYSSYREKLSHLERKQKSIQICNKVLTLHEWKNAKIVMLYVTHKSEVDTLPLIQAALKYNKNVLLPRVEGKEIVPYQIFSFPEDVAPGFANILEPVPKKCKLWEKSFDLVIVPGIVFDLQGGRLGYGKGYYDRFLKNLSFSPLKIGLTFEICLTDSLPLETHDMKVDIVVTEKRIIK